MVADGAEPPIDKACGEGLMPDTIGALKQIGIQVSTLDGFPLRGMRFLDGDMSVKAEFAAGQGIGVRRVVLHQHLMECAQRAGVTLLWRTSVTGISSAGVTMPGKTIAARWMSTPLGWARTSGSRSLAICIPAPLPHPTLVRLYRGSLEPQCPGVRHSSQQHGRLRRLDFEPSSSALCFCGCRVPSACGAPSVLDTRKVRTRWSDVFSPSAAGLPRPCRAHWGCLRQRRCHYGRRALS